MAHFARLDKDNFVTMVTVVSNADMIDSDGKEIEELGVAVCESVVGPGPWVQTSYNGSFRGRYAAVGSLYDPVRDLFLPRRPYPSWMLNADDEWEAPVPKPTDGKLYIWNEQDQSWDLIPEPIQE